LTRLCENLRIHHGGGEGRYELQVKAFTRTLKKLTGVKVRARMKLAGTRSVIIVGVLYNIASS
jgi:hypothetical protein